MSVEEENKKTVRRAADTFSAATFDDYLKFYHPDVTLHFVPPGAPQGRDGARAYYQVFLDGFPDVRVRVDDLVAEGDQVACRFTAEGTHRGNFMGTPATGKRVSVAGITVFKLANGQIIERWSEMNQIALLQQIGALPTP